MVFHLLVGKMCAVSSMTKNLPDALEVSRQRNLILGTQWCVCLLQHQAMCPETRSLPQTLLSPLQA